MQACGGTPGAWGWYRACKRNGRWEIRWPQKQQAKMWTHAIPIMLSWWSLPPMVGNDAHCCGCWWRTCTCSANHTAAGTERYVTLWPRRWSTLSLIFASLLCNQRTPCCHHLNHARWLLQPPQEILHTIEPAWDCHQSSDSHHQKLASTVLSSARAHFTSL